MAKRVSRTTKSIRYLGFKRLKNLVKEFEDICFKVIIHEELKNYLKISKLGRLSKQMVK